MNCGDEIERIEIFTGLIKHCGWIYPYGEACLVCDRPISLHLDDNYLLHAEEKPAIEYADGLCAYACHGIILPEEYGKLHPSKWDTQWLLSEQDSRVRSVLIQEIGYERIERELPAEVIDTWQEYSLLKIAILDDWEVEEYDEPLRPIYLLKETDTQNNVNIVRVSSSVKSVQEAINWLKYNIDLE